MRNAVKSSVAGALCAAMAVSLVPSEAQAGVMSVTDKSNLGLSSSVEQAHYRRYRHRHYYRHHGYYPRHYRYGYDPLGAAVAGAALGLMTAPHYGYGWGYPRYGYGWGYPYGWGW